MDNIGSVSPLYGNAPGSGRIVPTGDRAESMREFGEGAPTIQVKTLTLTAALDLFKVGFGGTAIWAVDASDLDAQIEIHAQDQFSSAFPFRKGSFIRGLRFSRLYIDADAQAGKWITLVIFRETIDIGKVQIANPASDFTNITVDKDDTIGTVADVTVTAAAAAAIVLAANADREYAILTNLNTNGKTLRIGDTNTAAARGIPLEPGESLTLHGTAAIYAYNPAGADEDLAIGFVAA